MNFFLAITVMCLVSPNTDATNADCSVDSRYFNSQKACDDFSFDENIQMKHDSDMVNAQTGETLQHMLGMVLCTKFDPNWDVT